MATKQAIFAAKDAEIFLRRHVQAIPPGTELTVVDLRPLLYQQGINVGDNIIYRNLVKLSEEGFFDRQNTRTYTRTGKVESTPDKPDDLTVLKGRLVYLERRVKDLEEEVPNLEVRLTLIGRHLNLNLSDPE